ncbi:retinoblastoma-associated protein A domain-containing protein [Ditylenchus destructor]|nr:retinoblastoma-associated protein A domain-containing protein [Ditylenchus destructor]
MITAQTKGRLVKPEEQVGIDENDGDHPSQEFLEIFDKLDATINGELIEKAWKQYDTVGQQVILEGPQKPWIACAFYTSAWQAAPLGAQEPVYKYSVSKLLNICNLSVLEFFEKLNKWAEMISAKGRLMEHINRVQANLAVSTVIYKKFLPIFRRVFLNQQPQSPAKVRSNQPQLTVSQIFEFTWIMYIAMKKQFKDSVDGLMDSYHLLLCIIHMIFENVNDMKLSSMLNTEFANCLEVKNQTPLEYMCEAFEGVVLDAKHFETHWLGPKLRSLADEGTIVGLTRMGGLLTDIPRNKKSFESLYEERMLKKAEIDERLFFSTAMTNIDTIFNEALDASAITMLRRSDLDSSWAIDAELLLRMSSQSALEKLNSQRNVQVPPSAKSYVITAEQFCPAAPVPDSVHKIQKITELLMVDFRNAESFEQLMSQCLENPKAFIANRVACLGDALLKKVEQERTSNGDAYDSNFTASIKQRKENVETLFYRLLHQVVMHDRERGMNSGMEAILHKPDFIGSLWICALELVLFSHGSEREFSWSADIARVAPVNFYKIIELVIRAEVELSRDMVKHLNKVEEQVLEEKAWALDSPLWSALAKQANNAVPSSRSVSLSAYDTRPDPYGNGQHYTPTSTLVGRYSSPMKPYDRPMAVKRPLHYDEYAENVDESIEGVPPRIKRPATGDYEMQQDYVQQEEHQQQQPLPSSVTVFFRKVYYLSAVRLSDLCDRIRMDETNRQKVWTLFEHVLREDTSLMVGRHLDQNLMCCLYIVAKVCGLETSFHDIMSHYRYQPQAVSRVYRRVLMDTSASPATVVTDDSASRDSVSSVSQGGHKGLRSSSALPAPDMASAPPTPEPHNLDYADLIRYYNRAFVPKVEDFVKRLTPSNTESKENIPLLIPMPKIHCNSLSPRRLVNEQINVMPLSSFPTLLGRPARYNFARSPSKDLKTINAMVRSAHIVSPHTAHGY